MVGCFAGRDDGVSDLVCLFVRQGAIAGAEVKREQYAFAVWAILLCVAIGFTVRDLTQPPRTRLADRGRQVRPTNRLGDNQVDIA